MIEDKFDSIMQRIPPAEEWMTPTDLALQEATTADPGVRVMCNTIEMGMPMHRKPDGRCFAGGQHSARGMRGNLEYPDLGAVIMSLRAINHG